MVHKWRSGGTNLPGLITMCLPQLWTELVSRSRSMPHCIKWSCWWTHTYATSVKWFCDEQLNMAFGLWSFLHRQQVSCSLWIHMCLRDSNYSYDSSSTTRWWIVQTRIWQHKRCCIRWQSLLKWCCRVINGVKYSLKMGSVGIVEFDHTCWSKWKWKRNSRSRILYQPFDNSNIVFQVADWFLSMNFSEVWPTSLRKRRWPWWQKRKWWTPMRRSHGASDWDRDCIDLVLWLQPHDSKDSLDHLMMHSNWEKKGSGEWQHQVVSLCQLWSHSHLEAEGLDFFKMYSRKHVTWRKFYACKK